jgi:hypothetical protein
LFLFFFFSSFFFFSFLASFFLFFFVLLVCSRAGMIKSESVGPGSEASQKRKQTDAPMIDWSMDTDVARGKQHDDRTEPLVPVAGLCFFPLRVSLVAFFFGGGSGGGGGDGNRSGGWPLL